MDTSRIQFLNAVGYNCFQILYSKFLLRCNMFEIKIPSKFSLEILLEIFFIEIFNHFLSLYDFILALTILLFTPSLYYAVHSFKL